MFDKATHSDKDVCDICSIRYIIWSWPISTVMLGNISQVHNGMTSFIMEWLITQNNLTKNVEPNLGSLIDCKNLAHFVIFDYSSLIYSDMSKSQSLQLRKYLSWKHKTWSGSWATDSSYNVPGCTIELVISHHHWHIILRTSQRIPLKNYFQKKHAVFLVLDF